MKKFTHRELVLHAVLLLRTKNKYDSKENHIALYDLLPDEQLMDYIEHFGAPEPENQFVFDEPEVFDKSDSDDYHYIKSCTYGDYSPSSPWNAPGMSVRDFI